MALSALMNVFYCIFDPSSLSRIQAKIHIDISVFESNMIPKVEYVCIRLGADTTSIVF